MPLEADVARVRIVVSPLFTAIAGLFEIVGGWRRGADERWVAGVLAGASGVDLSPFALFADEERHAPHLLTPVPCGPDVTWQQELATVAAASPEAVRDELLALREDHTRPAVLRWVEDPHGAHRAFVDSLDAWWRVALAPQWPRMQALLEAEVLRLARSMAVEGRGAALAAIHPRIRWDGARLTLPGDPETVTDPPLEDRELVLLPIACGPDGIITGTDHPTSVPVAYAAPGTASLFGPAPEGAAPDPLAEALGGSRAAVLRGLGGPAPLRVLARTVGLSPSTVHEHLAALQRAELVHRGKVGREVLYARTPRGHRLVDLF
jgi:DNA-binding transcriptional ArsR family regulator